MSCKYRYGRLVKNEFLSEHNNTWYYPINSYLYEYYSNNKIKLKNFKKVLDK